MATALETAVMPMDHPWLAPHLNATLTEVREVSSQLRVLRVRPDAGVRDFEPGQFGRLGFLREPLASEQARPKWLHRQYSIASAKQDKDAVEFFIALVEGGRVTPQLWRLSPGSRLRMEVPILGEFTLEPVPPAADVVMVSTGTGLAPFVSMVRSYRNANRWRRLVLINGVRLAGDLGYRQELESMNDQRTFFYLPMTTREPPESSWQGLRGRVQTLLEADRLQPLCGVSLDPASTHVMLCGNPDMIAGVQSLLTARGFSVHSRESAGNIHVESYW